VPQHAAIISSSGKSDEVCDEVPVMSKLMTTTQIVKENQQAMERAAKRAMRNKRTARAFLVRAGILNKRGKGLTKAYR
jgi:hypothetical protein